jgi:hypothetical protein
MIDPGLLWEGTQKEKMLFEEPDAESCITKYTLVYEDKPNAGRLLDVVTSLPLPSEEGTT